MAEEPVCIRRTATAEEADLIVAWLDDHGINATVLGHDSPGPLAFGVTDDEGIGIYVSGSETADRAKGLLADHDAQHIKGRSTAPDTHQVRVKCEECGRVSMFASDLAGTVQDCAKCGAYVDVPGYSRP